MMTPFPVDVLPTRNAAVALPENRAMVTLWLWFAIVAGLVEAAGLELFQKINWANWGHTTHVSPKIFWIAPLCDVVLFAPLIFLLHVLGRLVPRLPAVRTAVFLLALLTFYDWLALPERLVHRSAVILAIGLATVCLRIFNKRESQMLRVTGRSLPWLAAVVIIIFVGIGIFPRVREKFAQSNLPAAKTGSMNVAIIVVDTLRADHLSAYGYEHVTSPHLAQIAKQGVLFENAISTSSWTLPSHASLLSGRYSYEHGATDVKRGPVGFDDRYPSLAEVLEQHGYRTGAFSGNYLYFSHDLGFGRGFIRFEDYFHSAFDAFTRTLYGRELARTLLSRDKVRRFVIRIGFRSIDELQPSSTSSWMLRKRASEVNREALDWIDGDSHHPFFVFLNYFDVHRPYTTPPEYPRRFVHLSTHALYLDQLDSPTPGGRLIAYDECVGYADDQIGNFVDELKRRGLDGHTLLVITSDHGDLLGERGLFGHRNALYLPLIHVPLVFWQPGQVPSAVRIQTPVSNASIASTITDALGLSEKSKFPIPSLLPLWSAKQPIEVWPHPLSEVAHLPNESVSAPSRYGAMTSLVTPQYHYIFHEKFGEEIFDWKRDPLEKTSLKNNAEGQAAKAVIGEELRVTMSHPH